MNAEERELMLRPIVPENLLLNNKVRHFDRLTEIDHKLTDWYSDSIWHSRPHFVSLRCRCRYTWIRVIHGIHLLPTRHIVRLTAHHWLARWRKNRPILSKRDRHMVGRCRWRIEQFYIDLDLVLRFGEGLDVCASGTLFIASLWLHFTSAEIPVIINRRHKECWIQGVKGLLIVIPVLIFLCSCWFSATHWCEHTVDSI